MTEKVTVKFQADTKATLFGKMEIPKELWDQKSENENWSLAAQKYVAENYDPLTSQTEVDYDDVEFDYIKLTENEG